MIRSLLAGAIDYAGLFPPAALPMREAVANYRAYRQGVDAWALGRFVVPVARLPELASAALAEYPEGPTPDAHWRVSALVSGNGAADLDAIHAFNERYTAAATQGWSAAIDTVEARGATTAEVEALAAHRDATIEMFVEVAPDDSMPAVLASLSAHRLAAKIRTGGVSEEQFPSSMQVARFLAECARLSLPFKATAGLHHPLRASYRLTYEPESAHGTMFGFLNILLAAAAARAGGDVIELAQLLDERSASALNFDGNAMRWRDFRFTANEIEAVRSRIALSFGSCSFEEPLAELRALRLLEAGA
ncbi:MAG: hypothetical protein H0X64_04280 [Gemmatimonadaceae bacterium]|nr:hypothetical protein [Gemmatimonadaceae bacterium]